jgi:hypothetical protein
VDPAFVVLIVDCELGRCAWVVELWWSRHTLLDARRPHRQRAEHLSGSGAT